MKRQTTLVIMILMLLFMSLQITAKTHVLIIGNGDYEDHAIEDLPGALEDARRMKETLIQLDMAKEEDIHVNTNLPALNLKIAIREFLKQDYDKNDRLIFYYSGHGYSEEKQMDINTYLVPANTIESYRQDFLINLTDILKENMATLKDRETLILLDSCYSFGGHSQEGINASGKTDTYLLPKDVKTRFLERSAYNFREEWQERLSQKLKSSETLMIFDTCYAGGITTERGLKDIQLRSLEFEKIAEERNVNFLFSSKENQTSKEREAEPGGWFTYYLLEGIGTGAANYNKDLRIDAEEISRYLD